MKGLFKELQKFADDEKLKKGQDGENVSIEKLGIKKSDLFTSETIAGQMNSIGKMTHGKIPELVMGGTFTWDSVADYLNTRIFVGK